VKIAAFNGNGCHFGDFLAADQSIPVVQAFIFSEIDVRDALASLEVIRLNPIQEIAPCRNFDSNVDLTVVNLHIHVIHCPFTSRTSFSRNGVCSNSASTRGGALTFRSEERRVGKEWRSRGAR